MLILRKGPRLLALVLVFVLLLPAATASEEEGFFDDLAAGIELDSYSKYVWRGSNVVDDYVLQPAVDVSLHGFGLNVWGNLDLTDKNDDRYKFTEVDLTVSYSFSFEPVDFGVGSVTYLYPYASGDTTELYASVAYDTFLSPTLTAYRDIDDVGGTYVAVSLDHVFEDPLDLGEEVGLSPEITASVGFGSEHFNQANYGERGNDLADLTVGLSIPYRLGEKAMLAASIHYSTLLADDVRDAADKANNFWFGLSLSVSF